uniref:Endonuclease/exonuclease/phosphatase domain-containing protein n=1 Tax=Manihot esculenta TaxID=3983 RepID=A0A2C9VYA4_MANES
MIVGNFNDILYATEKESRVSQPQWQLEGFRSSLVDSGLYDLGYSGDLFAWNNGREGDDFVQERLDRALANMEWRNHFANVSISVLQATCSEYQPLWIDVCLGRDSFLVRRFRFENV